MCFTAAVLIRHTYLHASTMRNWVFSTAKRFTGKLLHHGFSGSDLHLSLVTLSSRNSLHDPFSGRRLFQVANTLTTGLEIQWSSFRKLTGKQSLCWNTIQKDSFNSTDYVPRQRVYLNLNLHYSRILCLKPINCKEWDQLE